MSFENGSVLITVQENVTCNKSVTLQRDYSCAYTEVYILVLQKLL